MAVHESERTGFLDDEKFQHLEAADESPKRSTVRKHSFIGAFFISLLLFSLIFDAPRQCYHHVSGKFSKTRTVEERVANILKETPLIGKPSNSQSVLLHFGNMSSETVIQMVIMTWLS